MAQLLDEARKPLTLDAFRELASRALEIDLTPESPHGELLSDERVNLFIPAGAGSGKTTGLALLTLQAIFVHDLPAEAIVATTFTRKAATELRSRITRGVMQMADLTGRRLDEPQLDVAAMRVGTIDDLSNQALVELQLGALIDGTVQKGLMRQAVFEGTGYFKREGDRRRLVQDYLHPLFGNPEIVTGIRNCAVTLNDRLGQDQIDIPTWRASSAGADQTYQIIEYYRESLEERGQMDFVLLEDVFLEQLREGGSRSGWRPHGSC